MMQKLKYNNIVVADKGFCELDLTFPYTYFVYNDQFTSCPYRIIHYLHIVSGENLVAPLKYYSDHIVVEEGQERIPYAIGPRIKNWIGPNELARAQQLDQELQEDDAFQSDMSKYYGVKEHCKPHGIDQLYETYFDIVNENKESTIIVRDPEIDLNTVGCLIPDLITISFSRCENVVRIFATFGSCENTAVLNDIWFLLQLLNMYKIWLGRYNNVNKILLTVKYINSDIKIEIPCYIGVSNNDFVCEPDTYWSQIRTLNKMVTHIMAFFDNNTLNNTGIDVNYLLSCLYKNFMDISKAKFGDFEPITIPFIRDMARVLIVSGICRHQPIKNMHSNIVDKLVDEMVTPLKYDLINYLEVNNYV